MTEPQTAVNVPFFKKSKARPTTARKRSTSPVRDTGPVKSQVVLPNKKTTTNLLSAGTKRKLSEKADIDDEEEKKDGPGVQWGAADASHIEAAREIIAGDELEELMAKRRRKDLDGQPDEEVPDDGQYRGMKAYKSHIQKSKEIPKAMRVGPQRNTSTIRTVTIVDYQPDVCKDYKETGYCGFGDTCKFLHDRGTYLAGWQLDKLAENPKKQVEDDSSSDSDSDEDVPFACLICRKHFTDPVVTRCGHYFCSACAIKRFAKTPKCLACGAPTGGLFNRADKIIAKIAKKKEEKGADGQNDSEGEGDHPALAIQGLAEKTKDSESEDSDDTDDD